MGEFLRSCRNVLLPDLEELYYLRFQLADATGRFFSPSMNKEPDYSPNRLPGRDKTNTDQVEYKRVMKQMHDITQLIQFTRSHYQKSSLNLQELAEFSTALYHLPHYLSLRVRSKVAVDAIPTSVMSLSIIMAGVTGVPYIMQESGYALKSHPTPHQIYETTEGGNPDHINYFVSEGNISCPAGQQVVESFLYTMLQYPKNFRQTQTDWQNIVTKNDVEKIIGFGSKFEALMSEYDDYRHLSTWEKLRSPLTGNIRKQKMAIDRLLRA